MAENKHELEHQPEVGHEASDVNAWAIGKFAIALVLLCIGSVALLLGLFHYFITREGPPPPKAYSDLARAGVKQPPAPQLETTPVLQLQRERAEEDRMLNSYGWIDKEHGIVRIPIEKAIDLLARKGLPSRSQAPATSSVSVPSESGLGPIMQQPGGPLAGGVK